MFFRRKEEKDKNVDVIIETGDGKELDVIEGNKKEVLEKLRKTLKQTSLCDLRISSSLQPLLSRVEMMDFCSDCMEICHEEMTPKVLQRKKLYEDILGETEIMPDRFTKNKKDLEKFKSIVEGQLERLNKGLSKAPEIYLR